MWEIRGDFEPEGVGPIDEVGVDCGPVRAVSTTRWGLALVGRVEASSRSVISGSMSLAYVVERLSEDIGSIILRSHSVIFRGLSPYAASCGF